jgi:cyclic pyranopterin phosphate synthase
VTQRRTRRLTHVDARGAARMVDVSEKDRTVREATAEARVVCSAETLALVREGRAAKGDVLAVARIAGIAAAKRACDLIPLCHPIALTGVAVDLAIEERGIRITATTRAADRTGVEMEALAAAAAAALTVYDMLKAAERGMEITGLRLLRKSGGRSGTWARPAAPAPATPSPRRTAR